MSKTFSVPMSKTFSVLSEVFAERSRQDDKWGQQDHHPAYWIGVLGEEFGEACKGAVEFDKEAYRRELIETAAVAVAAVESLDRGEYPTPCITRGGNAAGQEDGSGFPPGNPLQDGAEDGGR